MVPSGNSGEAVPGKLACPVLGPGQCGAGGPINIRACFYDFGDGWEQKLKVEKTLTAVTLPRFFRETGEHVFLPEDTGGAQG